MEESEGTRRILDAIESLRSEVARLDARIALLEAERAAPSASTDASTPDEATIDLDTMMSICAALAAYFGHRPRIRSIRLLGSDVWAHQGRATSQAWYSTTHKR